MTEGDYQNNIVDLIQEIAPEFKRSNIITELELKNQDYSLSDVKGLYENGIGAVDSSSVGGAALDTLHVCMVGYSVLMRLGIGKDEYIKWAEQQDYVNAYILKRIVGIIDKEYEAAFVTLCVEDRKNQFRSDNARAMLAPTDEATVLSLFGHNVAPTEKMLTYLEVKREIFSISEIAAKQFETEYNASISNYVSLQKNLMMVIQDVAELTLDGIKKYLKKKECESQYEFIEKKYLDLIAENSPYIIVLEGLEQICYQYQSKSVKNEVDRLRRESRHFIGGGFGIRGSVTGIVMAKAANSVAGAFNGAVNGINNWLNDTRMQSKLDKLANAPKQREMYIESIQKSILALEDVFCNVLCPADSMEVMVDESFMEFCQEVTMPPMLLKASPSELQEVLYLSLLKQPFVGYLKVAFDILGDKDNELEILAGCTGQTDFLKYKYKKQKRKDEEIPRFPLIEELMSDKKPVMSFLNEFIEIKKAIQGGKWSYKIAKDMIEKLHEAYVLAHRNVPAEYERGFNCCLQWQEDKMLQMLQEAACMAGDHSYVNYFEAYLTIGYAEKFEDIYTKYTLAFVRDFSNEDFDKRIMYLSQMLFNKRYSAFVSKEVQDYVDELLEKLAFIKYMSKNLTMRGGKEAYAFSSLFQARFRGLLEVAKTIPSYGTYENEDIWSTDFLKNVVSEYDYRCTDEDVRKTIGEPCGQYVFIHIRYEDSESKKFKSMVLTDRFLYLGERKIAIQQLTTISHYIGHYNIGHFGRIRRGKIYFHLWKERLRCNEKLFEVSSLLPQFYNTIRHSMPDLVNVPQYSKVYECFKCGSHNIKDGLLKSKCEACGASDSGRSKEPTIGVFFVYGPFRDKAESAFKCVEETSYDKWCRELMEAVPVEKVIDSPERDLELANESTAKDSENQAALDDGTVTDEQSDISDNETVYKQEKEENKLSEEYQYCLQCGNKMLVGKKFCSKCGHSLLVQRETITKESVQMETVVCPKCSNLIKAGKKFCSVCGTKVQN